MKKHTKQTTKTQRKKASTRKTATNAEKQTKRVSKTNKTLRTTHKQLSAAMEQIGMTQKPRKQQLAKKQPKQPWKKKATTNTNQPMRVAPSPEVWEQMKKDRANRERENERQNDAQSASTATSSNRETIVSITDGETTVSTNVDTGASENLITTNETTTEVAQSGFSDKNPPPDYNTLRTDTK